MRQLRLSFAQLLIVLLTALSGTARAETYSAAVGTKPAPEIGDVLRANAATTYVVNASTGAVNVTGPGTRLSNAAVTTPQITVQCNTGGGGSCSNSNRTVTIAFSGGAGATITNFTITTPTGNIQAYTGPTSGFPLVMPIRFSNMNNNKTATFKLGMTINLPGNATTGLKTMPFTVTIGP